MRSRGAGNLPSEVADLVGRSRELVQVREILSHTRILTLTGVGGVGKTKLAVRVGRRLEGSYPKGVWLVELAAFADPTLLTGVVARALGVAEDPGSDLETSIVARLGGGSALLLLDNCEHLLDASANLVHRLLGRCPELRVLATSRAPLGLEGETTLAVAPLDLPTDEASNQDVGAALGYGAVRLFVERATAADPHFRVDEKNIGAIVEVCRRLEGIPLGLELAAVRLRSLSLADLQRRLDDQLSLSNLNRSSAATRHKTLTATLDWSYELLDTEERLLWTRLSVFSGGFTFAAVEQVCSDEHLMAERIFDALTSLLEKSIVVIERQGLDVRYRLLEPVRLYGLDRLRDDRAERSLRMRHLDWCLEETAGTGPWWTGVGQVDWIRRVGDEHANVRAALDVCVADVDQAVRGLELVEQVSHVWLLRSWHSELLHYLERLLRIEVSPSRVRARCFYSAGIATWLASDFTKARQYFENAEALARGRRGFELERGLAAYGFGLIDVRVGEHQAATKNLNRAIKLFDYCGARVMQASALLFLIETRLPGELSPQELRSLVERSLDVSRGADDFWNLGRAHFWLGIIDAEEGRLNDAQLHLLEALRLQHEIGHIVGVMNNLYALAEVAATAGRSAYAAEILGVADRLSGDFGRAPARLLERKRANSVSLARHGLGDERFDAIYGVGKGRRLEIAVPIALGAVPGSRTASNGGSALTSRELEIARLVATGATNRRIAESLVISDQTVKFHVHNILEKLGFESRREIAAWDARRQLTQDHPRTYPTGSTETHDG